MVIEKLARYWYQTSFFQKKIGVITTRNLSAHATAPRTNDDNPSNHNQKQIGLFYTVQDDVQKKLFSFGGFPKPYKLNTQTFAETSIMIREPALEIINFLKTTNFSHPAVRYVLYGKPGCGKSITLLHILHYGHTNKFFLLHVPWVWDWFKNNRTDVASSPFKPGLVDLPVVSAAWLKHFQSQNSELLAQDLVKTSKDYVWNQRESTPAGSSLSDLVIHGINRIKYAAACIDALVYELKLAASHDKCKALVVIDGFNALFGTESNFKTEDKVKVTPSMVTLTHTFLEATKHDWINGAVVVAVDERARMKTDHKSHLPLYLLGRKGFEHLDPFIAVKISEFSDLEFQSMMNYYEDRNWIQRRGAREELSFLSNNNPFKLMKLSNSL